MEHFAANFFEKKAKTEYEKEIKIGEQPITIYLILNFVFREKIWSN